MQSVNTLVHGAVYALPDAPLDVQHGKRGSWQAICPDAIWHRSVYELISHRGGFDSEPSPLLVKTPYWQDGRPSGTLVFDLGEQQYRGDYTCRVATGFSRPYKSRPPRTRRPLRQRAGSGRHRIIIA